MAAKREKSQVWLIRALRQCLQWIQTLLTSNRGTWVWLKEKQIPLASLNRSFWRRAVPSVNFYAMLGLSGVICTLGLLANSTAVIIGAMIVTPLLDPVITLAFAMSVGNRRLMKRTLITVSTGVILAVSTAFILTRLVGIENLGSEILERTQPNVLHLAVAIAAGAAGGFANTRRSVGTALPGVAISVALLPPLNVMGICLALGMERNSAASSLLFTTNLIGILFGASLVFLIEGYGSLSRARHGLLLSLIVTICLGTPLAWSFRTLLIEEQTRQSVTRLVHFYGPLSGTVIDSIQVNYESQEIQIRVRVATPHEPISRKVAADLKSLLEEELHRSVSLRLDMIPIQTYSLD